MAHPKSNRYRSGAKNPHIEVLVSQLDDGYAVAVIDHANWRINTTVVGKQLTDDNEGDNIKRKP